MIFVENSGKKKQRDQITQATQDYYRFIFSWLINELQAKTYEWSRFCWTFALFDLGETSAYKI